MISRKYIIIGISAFVLLGGAAYGASQLQAPNKPEVLASETVANDPTPSVTPWPTPAASTPAPSPIQVPSAPSGVNARLSNHEQRITKLEMPTPSSSPTPRPAVTVTQVVYLDGSKPAPTPKPSAPSREQLNNLWAGIAPPGEMRSEKIVACVAWPLSKQVCEATTDLPAY